MIKLIDYLTFMPGNINLRKRLWLENPNALTFELREFKGKEWRWVYD